MTGEQTVKGLEICSSEHLGCEDGCPYVEVACLGGDALLKDALALVKKKDTEIDILIRKNETLKDENFELKAEVERLREFGNKLRKAYTTAYSNGFELCKGVFFKKLENALGDNIDISHAQYESIMFDVHNIVDWLKIKELTE